MKARIVDITNARPVYNLAAIMDAAHTATRACVKSTVAYRGWTYAAIFARQLSRIWAEAKAKAVAAQPVTRAEILHRAIACLEAKERTTPEDREKMVELRAELHRANASDYDEKRGLIEAEKGRIVAVTFTKKDGTEREMKVQPAKLKFHVKGDAAADARQRAVATRKARHPNLLPVWDVDAQAPRSINLGTVTRIAAGGHVHVF